MPTGKGQPAIKEEFPVCSWIDFENVICQLRAHYIIQGTWSTKVANLPTVQGPIDREERDWWAFTEIAK